MYPWSTKCESKRGTRQSEQFVGKEQKEKKPKKGSYFLRKSTSKKSLLS